jgi:hypothetical protein
MRKALMRKRSKNNRTQKMKTLTVMMREARIQTVRMKRTRTMSQAAIAAQRDRRQAAPQMRGAAAAVGRNLLVGLFTI